MRIVFDEERWNSEHEQYTSAVIYRNGLKAEIYRTSSYYFWKFRNTDEYLPYWLCRVVRWVGWWRGRKHRKAKRELRKRLAKATESQRWEPTEEPQALPEARVQRSK